VDIDFSTTRLFEASISLSKANRFFGMPIGRKHIQRIAVLRATGKFDQLFGLQALRFHTLKGNRAGQYSMILTGNYRLIVEKIKENRIRILDVEDYHGN
jgi:plasmid maintenance system killer protein